MSILNKLRLKNASDRLMEERLYEAVSAELHQGHRREGLWVKALAKSRGNEKAAISIYISLRVQSIIDENRISEMLASEVAAETARNEINDLEAQKKHEKRQIEEEKRRIKDLKKRVRRTGGKYID